MPGEAPADGVLPSGQPVHRLGWPLRIGLATLLLAVGGAVAAAGVTSGARIVPNVIVADVPVGRLDVPTATAVLALADPEVPAVAHELVVTTPDGVVRIPTADLGVALDPTASARRALGVGRTGRPIDLLVRLRALRRTTVVPPAATADEAAVRTAVDRIATTIDRPAAPGGLTVDPETLAVEVVPPTRGVTVRRDEAVTALLAAIAAGDRHPVTLPADVTPAPGGRADLEVLAARVEAALTADLVLVADGTGVRVTPAELAAAIEIRPGTATTGPALHLDRRRLARSVGPRIVAAFDRDGRDASLVTPTTSRFTDMGSTRWRPIPVEVTVDAGRTERRFRMERTALQLEAMIRSGRRIATADLLEVPPPVTTDDLQRHPLPTHLLGTFTTFHPAGADRTINIRRLADTLDGVLVAPGAELSLNRVSGERRCEDGYVPAGTIVLGELIDTCGGGVSQFGTTAYNAAFFAGLPTPQWQPHSFHIGRYPMGREATLSYPELDVRAVNATDGWLLVRTSHTPTSITVALFGRPIWAEVRAAHGPTSDPTPFPTELRPAGDLAPGEERVLQPGGDGFTLEVARELVPSDGGPVVVERTRTVYRPQTRIVEVGVGVDGTVADSDGGDAGGTAP